MAVESQNCEYETMQHIVIDPGGALPRAGLAYVVPDSREAIEAAVEALIARLDAADGDMDLEEIDEREPDDDAKGDPSWTEWHTRGRHKGGTGVTGKNGRQVHEDAEDDDPGGGNVDDGPHDPETDFGAEEMGERDEAENAPMPVYGIDQTTLPLNINDWVF